MHGRLRLSRTCVYVSGAWRLGVAHLGLAGRRGVGDLLRPLLTAVGRRSASHPPPPGPWWPADVFRPPAAAGGGAA